MSLSPRGDGATSPRHRWCCDHGWVFRREGPVPTVEPCSEHQPGLYVLWELGCFAPEVADWWAEAA